MMGISLIVLIALMALLVLGGVVIVAVIVIVRCEKRRQVGPTPPQESLHQEPPGGDGEPPQGQGT